MDTSVFELDARAVAKEFNKFAREYSSMHAASGGGWFGVSIGEFREDLGVVIFIPKSLTVRVLDEPNNIASGDGVFALLTTPGTSEVQVSGIDGNGIPFSEMVIIENIALG